MITQRDIENLVQDPKWNGRRSHGFTGCREMYLEAAAMLGRRGDQNPVLQASDAFLLEHLNTHNISLEAFQEWAVSQAGRMYGAHALNGDLGMAADLLPQP